MSRVCPGSVGDVPGASRVSVGVSPVCPGSLWGCPRYIPGLCGDVPGTSRVSVGVSPVCPGSLGGVPGASRIPRGCPRCIPGLSGVRPGSLGGASRGSHAPRPAGSPVSVDAALAAVWALFPRGLFGDALPPLLLRHQLYDVVRDRTAVDRHLNRLRDEGQVRLLHLGLGPDALGVVRTELYRDKALQAVAGTPREGLVRRFLDEAVAATPELSYDRGRMESLGFGDSDVTQLVVSGVLTVRDAGSWWLAVPGVGRFVRALLRGRRALLSVVRRSRHREVPLRELQRAKPPPGARLGVPFLLHDLLGAQELLSVPTPAGPLLRLAEP
ncbi:serine/threonine-protein kinase 19 isoform X2 [Myiozetetes cayanensis]|uniref:serine/threonine-protein kinase 19 isoform X2 n=1 Tax=Myiozetetes cayanensis TaxID=478635 RepID=UPI00215E98D7|nr:serine/threonine-protein kinase 19 isoform X2 [Myiozetetes cayanensis]